MMAVVGAKVVDNSTEFQSNEVQHKIIILVPTLAEVPSSIA